MISTSRSPGLSYSNTSTGGRAPGLRTASLPALLQQVLQHGCGVGGPRLSALDGALKVLDASAALPDFLELSRQNLGAALPSEARLLEVQLAHLHVILTSHEQDGWLVGVELHLPGDPGPIEVGVPPALLLTLRVFVLVRRADERDSKESLLPVHFDLLLPGRKLSGRVLLR